MPTASDHDRDGRPVIPAGRPATVWPCPPTNPDQWPAGWLTAAVERLVVASTRPGDPVLLLTPPALDEDGSPTAAGDDDTITGLAETGWAVARLGRPVRFRTGPADPTMQRSGSGPGPATGQEADDDRHPLVVTVVSPTRHGWFTHIPWDQLVAPGGTLAVITRSDSLAGWLIDPTIDLTTATGRHGLALLDRIVLLEIPLDQLDQPTAPLPAGKLAWRVHSDLLLFTPISSTSTPGWSQHQ
ncbi:hypothetical protein [Frankia tisae]|uniref:hypothetical protein n=1 Tax=Frankia tisae TaxID=2950104 RepID=UPI0021BE3F47|nr:hypothetical protein [Frankia tisae]